MRILMLLFSVVILTGCAAPKSTDASLEAVRASVYVPEGPPKLTLITVINNTSGSGAHTALMVSGTQQVIFDPAGTFQHMSIPKRGDVLYGVTPGWLQSFKSAHARSTFHVVSQEIQVTPEQAARALALVQANGSVSNALCARATGSILRQVPGFEDISVTFFPAKLMEQFAERPGVKTDKYYENDAGDVRDGILAAQS